MLVALIASVVTHDCYWCSEDNKVTSSKSVDKKC
jgi:hypothetical protein